MSLPFDQTGDIEADPTSPADGTPTKLIIRTGAVVAAMIGVGAVEEAKIADNAVTNAKAANVPTGTFKGRTTAGTGDPEDLTATQATAMLNVFQGDAGAGGLKGLVPAPAAGDTAARKVLRPDATWGEPAASAYLHTHSGSTTFQWTSTTWAGIHNVLTLSDISSLNISRADSSFTLSLAGVYLLQATIPVYNNGTGQHVGLRARRSSTSLASQHSYVDASTALCLLHLHAIVSASASDVIVLEYAVSGSTASGLFTALDSQNPVCANITIARLGA